ncbi:hypothetical protein CJ030_MR2G012891 [Morella rubra]|uniref:Uncharacterized protein n=1 Tax=Morella rubra TaxID=262757 RepID=A0A6A1WLR9_9ROSI|nr:hypothetical protein CJ030_MR2G012891 [Morella rubra]
MLQIQLHIGIVYLPCLLRLCIDIWHLPEPNAIDVLGTSDCSSAKSRTLVVLLGCYQFGGKAKEHIDLLVSHLADWLEEEHGKNLVFHT